MTDSTDDCPFDGPGGKTIHMSDEEARERFGDMMDDEDDLIVIHADRKTGRMFVASNDNSDEE